MADPATRWPDNVPGPVFVDEDCICCAACIAVAPDHFDYADGGDYAVVVRQPDTPDAWDDVRDAVDMCPVDAIGVSACGPPRQ